jgi:hypothetical protein
MSHRPHGDVHETLFDACSACEEIALNPFANADEEVLRRLIRAAIAQPRTLEGTETELIGVKHVLDALERAGRISSCDPSSVERYLGRWGIKAILTRAGI